MNGIGLTTVGKLLGHRKRATTAIYAHLDDAALRDAAAQAATVIARAMGYKAAPPPLPGETSGGNTLEARPEFLRPSEQSAQRAQRAPLWLRAENTRSDGTPSKRDPKDKPGSYFY